MTRKIVPYLFLLIPLISFSQLTQSETEKLRQELSTRINNLRLSKGLKPLIFNDTLKKAAEFHSAYMAENDVLTHDEKPSKYATPEKRVHAFEGKYFEHVGENVLFSTVQSFPLKKKDISALADEMFTSWKNSPGHYANMTDPEYEYGDLGFKANLNKQVVFATHVFAKKGFVVQNQLSNNTFGLVKAPEDCEKEYEQFSNLVLNMGNDLKIEGNEVVLYYHDIGYFNKLFFRPNDGVAIDLVSREQLECGKPNQLDMSQVYDGILLKPYYSNEMVAANRAESDYRVITKVADIPEHLLSREFSPSLILIKNGKACKNIYPALLPSDDYELRPLDPVIKDEPSVRLVQEGIIYSQVINYDFKTNITKPVKLPHIEKHDAKIHSVKIQSYSSVEGDSIHNAFLHNSRADFIKEHVHSNTKIANDLLTIDAKENWDEMDFQFNYFGEGHFAELKHDSIKSIIRNKTLDLPWDSLLYSQRRSLAIINYSGIYNEQESPESLAEFNLRTAVATGNASLANKALYEMYHTPNYDPSILFEPQIIDFFKKQKTPIGNYAALLSYNFSFDPYIVSDFIHSWLNRTDQLNSDAKFNLLHLYTLVGSYLLDNWDVSSERLTNVIHPKKIERLNSKEIKPELALNLQLTFLHYYGQINDGINTSKSFYYIADYFKNLQLKKEDDVDLALFFNYWSMYDLTLEHLLPRFKKNELNEDGLFVLTHTMNFTNYKDNEGVYIEVNKKAIETNPLRWCDWITQDFQVKRNYQVKRLYCETCN